MSEECFSISVFLGSIFLGAKTILFPIFLKHASASKGDRETLRREPKRELDEESL